MFSVFSSPGLEMEAVGVNRDFNLPFHWGPSTGMVSVFTRILGKIDSSSKNQELEHLDAFAQSAVVFSSSCFVTAGITKASINFLNVLLYIL